MFEPPLRFFSEGFGVIDMALLSVIRRRHFREHFSIREISRRTGLSRNTVRKYLRSGEVEPRFKVPRRPSKLDPYADRLSAWLKTEPAGEPACLPADRAASLGDTVICVQVHLLIFHASPKSFDEDVAQALSEDGAVDGQTFKFGSNHTGPLMEKWALPAITRQPQ